MENKEGCPIKGCVGKLLAGSVITFILLFVMGFLVHHVWLMPIYQATASLWRPMEQVQALMPLMVGYYAVLAVLITALFCKIKRLKMKAFAADGTESECKIAGKHCPIKLGICFGAMIGALLGVANAGAFIWTPIPGELAIKWMVAWVIEGIVIGVVLSLACHYQKNCAAK